MPEVDGSAGRSAASRPQMERASGDPADVGQRIVGSHQGQHGLVPSGGGPPAQTRAGRAASVLQGLRPSPRSEINLGGKTRRNG